MNTRRLFDAIEHYTKGDWQSTSGCVEPGYNDKPVILANWNNIPQKLYDLFEKYGFSCEWQDEWITCDECYKSFRSSPDSYSWEMYGYIGDGFAVCGDCIDWDEYLSEKENRSKQAVTCSLFYSHKDEIESRYELVQDDFQNGFYPGQTDNPKEILAKLLEKNPNERYLFVITEQSQFYITFAVYVKKSESEE